MTRLPIKTLFCYLLLSLAGSCSLVPTKEEEALRAVQQRREQRQQALARIDNYKTHCRDMGFSSGTDVANCQLELSIAYDEGVLLGLRSQWQAQRFLDVAGNLEKSLEGFKQLCSDVGLAPATEAYGNCVLKLQAANRNHIETVIGIRDSYRKQNTNIMWTAWAAWLLAYAIYD